MNANSIFLVSKAKTLGVILDSSPSNPKSKNLLYSRCVQNLTLPHHLSSWHCGPTTFCDLGQITNPLLPLLLVCKIMRDNNTHP